MPDYFSLVALGCDSINLRTRLTVSLLHIVTHTGSKQRFAVFLSDNKNHALILPNSVYIDKSESRRQHSLFPQFELNEFAAHFALAVTAEILEEFQHMVRAFVGVKPFTLRVSDVADKLFVCSAYLLSDNYFSALNSLVVFNYRIVVFRIALHIITSFVYPEPERR